MTNRIQPQEWEQISAYLDDQLSPQDRAHLEARMKEEPELRQGWEEMRRTRVILRSGHLLRAPRNFTLTPAMAGQRRSGWSFYSGSYNVLRLASVLATVFFVLITVGDITARRFAPEPLVVSVAGEMEQPAFGMGGGGGGGGAPDEIAVASGVAESETEPAVAPAASEDATEMRLIVTPVASEASALQAEKEGNATAPEAPVEVARETTTALPQAPTVLIRVLQGLLALLALGAGLAALYFRRMPG